MSTNTKSDAQFAQKTFGVKVNTTYAPSGAKLDKKISHVHLEHILKRRVKRK